MLVVVSLCIIDIKIYGIESFAYAINYRIWFYLCLMMDYSRLKSLGILINLC